MLEFLAPVEHFGRKFDRAMTLFEFSALREPERTQFPQIGAWLRAKGIEFREVPTPQMLWRGKLWPDLYIANRLDALKSDPINAPDPCWDWSEEGKDLERKLRAKDWKESTSLRAVSELTQGGWFHGQFIEPMCRKITGLPSSEIAAKFHRQIWCPLYWPQTLRARASIRTPFYYPTSGYAGYVGSRIHGGNSEPSSHGQHVPDAEWVQINVAYVVAAPRQISSVLFVVDDSPIYRVTNQDACAGTVGLGLSRLIVEYRGECNVAQELERLGIIDHSLPSKIAFGKMRMTLPSIENVKRGWRPRPHLNDQFWRLMNGKD